MSKRISAWDYSILFFCCIIIANSYLMSYDSQLRWEGIKGQLLFMFAFILGENFKNNDILYRGRYIFGIIVVVAFLLYIVQPSWYVAYRLSVISEKNVAESTLLEMTRLSGFWIYPYWVSYGSAIYFHYIICKMLNKEIVHNNILIASLVLLVLIVILTQQRAPLFLIVLSIFIYFSKSMAEINVKKLLKILTFGCMLIAIVYFFCKNYLSAERLDFILDKFMVFQSGNSTSFVSDRANIFETLLKKNISFWGDGIGRYGHGAFFEGSISVTDQQYIQLLYETGLFGLLYNVLMLLICLILGFKHFDKCKFEVGVILFYLLAMSGANCLSSIQLHPIILWYCCGVVIFKTKRKLQNVEK
ncbi:hypothetical protein [Segatella copri]|uniref:Uncharacterized protein n=2 Tax=Segatella copri TaxID=165179 RepID=A0AAW9TJ45_9BACT|nr:hypothetical protein [Segatella copri]MQN27648.1 hypothetical protein [Segatella copri]MQN32584.1 hypothetical protein [Segatella copri]MQN38404.1 hypothetical protein [Segatella copri]MQN76035.1 hypothetical protein [Segatella copri]MQO27347.1 hypothetical protein [Segatella copri]